MGIFRKSIDDNVKDFYKEHGQYEIASVTIYRIIRDTLQSLCVSLNEKDNVFNVFKPGDFSSLKDLQSLINTAASQISHYYFGQEPGDKVDAEILKRRRVVNQHVPIWAEELLNRFQGLTEIVVQTLRMHMVFQTYLTNKDWLLDEPAGKRISEILNSYGNRFPMPDPKSFNNILKKWIMLDGIRGDFDLIKIGHK